MEFLAATLKQLLGVEPSMALTYFICVVIGVSINWAKACRENNLGLWQYWSRYPIRSQTAIIGTISAFLFTVITDPDSGKLTYIAIGYACDNLLNKTSTDGKAAEVQARMDAVVQVQQQKMEELVKSLPNPTVPPV